MKTESFIKIIMAMTLVIGGAIHAETPEPPLVARTVNGAYVEFKDQLTWVIQNPKRANQFPEFKKILLKRCNQIESKPEAYEKLIPLKKKALTAAGWYEEWNQLGFKKVGQVGLEMMKGDFTNDPLALLVVMEKEGSPKDELALARHYAPLALMQSFASKDELAKLEGLSKKAVLVAEKELITTTPQNNFWLGGNWNPALLTRLKKIMPNVFKAIQDECFKFNQNSSAEPAHVNTQSCSLIHRQD
jgi:hypothetical protein